MCEAHEDGRNYVSVSIGLKSDDLDPVAVTRELGIEPTRAFRKGDVELGAGRRRPVPRPWGVWSFEVAGENVQDAVLSLLDKVGPVRQRLSAVAQRSAAEVTVGIWWEPAGGQGGFSLPSDVWRRLAEVCERVDVYFSSARSDKECPSTTPQPRPGRPDPE